MSTGYPISFQPILVLALSHSEQNKKCHGSLHRTNTWMRPDSADVRLRVREEGDCRPHSFLSFIIAPIIHPASRLGEIVRMRLYVPKRYTHIYVNSDCKMMFPKISIKSTSVPGKYIAETLNDTASCASDVSFSVPDCLIRPNSDVIQKAYPPTL